MARQFTARSKAVGVSFQGGGIHYGIVRKVDGTKVYVEMPAVSSGFAFGPCIVSGVIELLTVGDPVICGFLDNKASELVVLGKVLLSTSGEVQSLDGGSA